MCAAQEGGIVLCMQGVVLLHRIFKKDDALYPSKIEAAPRNLGMSDLWRVTPAHGTDEP